MRSARSVRLRNHQRDRQAAALGIHRVQSGHDGPPRGAFAPLPPAVGGDASASIRCARTPARWTALPVAGLGAGAGPPPASSIPCARDRTAVALMRQLSHWARYVVLLLVVMAAVWTLLASMGFAYAEDLVGGLPPLKLAIAWWLYFIWWRTDPAVWLWLQISGGAAAAFIVLAVGVFGAGMLRRRLQLRPARSTERWMPRPIRAASDNHGHA